MNNKNLSIIKQNIQLRNENAALKNALKVTSTKLSFAEKRIKQLEQQFENYKKNEEDMIESIVKKAVKKVTEELNKAHQEEVNKLNVKIHRLEKRLNTSSENSGLPTSKNPIGKKVIQNNREATKKSIGGQKGHKKSKLDYFKEEEITEIKKHVLNECPKCGGKLLEKNIVISDILDVDIKITKTRNEIQNYTCSSCHKNVTANSDLPRGASYGENVKSIALSLMNESNTALNKTTSFISGISNNEINMSGGYLAKLQKESSNKLSGFLHDLSEQIISLKHLHWDDTTVYFGMGKPAEGYDEKDEEYMKELVKKEKLESKKVREGIIRFYGDDKWALLVGHRFKNEKGIEDDGILENLPKDCVVVHDHVLLNYNDKYEFKNAECNEHIKRYLKKNMTLLPKHKWAKKMKDLLTETNKRKLKIMNENGSSFTEQELNEISENYNEIIKLGYQENVDADITLLDDLHEELNLLSRLDKYKENHLMFAYDFKTPFTNNTAERGLRQTKRKLAVSFMFKNANRMKDYARILSYLETCYRHGISRFEACKRLVNGNPFTIEELKKKNEVSSPL